MVGNPALADPEAGRRLVDHFGRYLAGVIQDARAFPIERLVRGRGGASASEESRELP